MPNAYSDDEGVLQNKLGLTDVYQLSKAEYELASIRADEILTGTISLAHLSYNLDRLMAIHLHLFQDIYAWAGKLRTVYSTKRSADGIVTRFAAPEIIQSRWQEVALLTQAFVSGEDGSEHNFVQQLDRLVEIFIRANHVHAFPDGNGRSLQVFMMALAREQSIRLDYAQVGAKDWKHACALSCDHGRMFEHMHFVAQKSNPEPIRAIFAQIARKIVSSALQTRYS